MSTFVFRNHTVEPFLGHESMIYSGYGDISIVPRDVDRYIWFYQVPVNADSHQLAEEIDSYCGKLDLALDMADPHALFIIFSLVDLFPVRLTGDDRAVAVAVMEFNRHAAALASTRHNVKWVDFSEFTLRFDAGSLINWKYYFMSQMLLSPKLARDFKSWWHHLEGELALRRMKCLVLDLDNTLWGGVLGEDGLDGIRLGGDYPGNAYACWQRALLQLQQEGVILAICSKNNENDVMEVWQHNPDMVLQREHFSAMRINWHDKATNLQELANELNIGLDSMVFVDDNPAEQELVRQMLPQVTVPEFPEKPYMLMPFFKQLVERYFRIYSVTSEDRAKAQQYQANALRRADEARFPDMESYLYSLDMQLEIKAADEHCLARIAQMTQKTNQFNLTTRRYSEAEVQQHLDQGWMVYCLSVSDRFGDSGITATIFLEPADDDVTVRIDSLLLSCRILGKGIEEAFFKTILNLLRLDGYRKVQADYLPTAKNGQTADFYDRMGMTMVLTGDDGSRHYELELNDVFEIKNYYNIKVI